MDMDISAIICTFNRAVYLRKAIESLAEQTLPRERYEILVVDNCSTDATKQTVLEAQNVAPNLRYLYEPIQGLSQCRNTGLASAAGRYIAYLDDDAVADRRWLESILDCFNRSQADAVGGASYLTWENEPESWLQPRFHGYLGYLDLGNVAKPLRSPEYPFGLNMAFKKSSLVAVGGFPAFLGRSGCNLMGNEERAVFTAMEEKGMQVWYEPNAAIHHFVPKERMSVDFMLRRSFAQGASDAIFHRRIQKISTARYLFNLIRSAIWILFIGKIRLLVVREPRKRLKAEMSIALRRGYISQALPLRFSK